MPYPSPHPRHRRARRVHGPRARRQVDDHAVAPGHHLGQDQLGQDHRGHDVGFQMAVEQFDRGVEDPVHVTGSDVATVVDQHVDLPELREDGPHGWFERRPVEQVHVDGQGPGSRRFDECSRRVEGTGERPGVRLGHRRRVLPRLALVHGPCADGHVETALGQVDGDGLSDAPAGTGHQGHRPGPFLCHLGAPCVISVFVGSHLRCRCHHPEYGREDSADPGQGPIASFAPARPRQSAFLQSSVAISGPIPHTEEIGRRIPGIP